MTKYIRKIKDSGFTIVELLVVIVVIGILAAITIVSYSGITQRANTSAGQSAANAVYSKAMVYMADGPTNNYPATLSALTTAASTTTYYTTGVTYNALSAAPSSNNMVRYTLCGTGATTTAPANYPAITTPTGFQVYYWDYSAGTVATPYQAGVVSGTVGTYNVACFAAGS